MKNTRRGILHAQIKKYNCISKGEHALAVEDLRLRESNASLLGQHKYKEIIPQRVDRDSSRSILGEVKYNQIHRGRAYAAKKR